MKKERIMEILEAGAGVYWDRNMLGFEEWAKESFNGGEEGKLARFYVDEVGRMNSGGSRLLCGIPPKVQEDILNKYLVSE